MNRPKTFALCAALATTWFSLRLAEAGYDPTLGRWLSRDPINNAELRQGPNLYAYSANDPANSVDPLGLDVIRYRDPWNSPNGMGLHQSTQIGGKFGGDGFGTVGLTPASATFFGIFGGRAAILNPDDLNSASPNLEFRIYKTPSDVDAALWNWFLAQQVPRYFLGLSDCSTMADRIDRKMMDLMEQAGYSSIPYVDGYRTGGGSPVFTGAGNLPILRFPD